MTRSLAALTLGSVALMTIFGGCVEALYWGGIRNREGVRNLFTFTGESSAGVAACRDADLVSCRRISVDLEALLEDDRLFVPGVGVIDKEKPDAETVDEFGISHVEFQLEEDDGGEKRRKVKEGIGQITFNSASASIGDWREYAHEPSGAPSCRPPRSATLTYDLERGSVVGAIGGAHSVENCGKGCHVFKTFDRADKVVVLVVEWNL